MNFGSQPSGGCHVFEDRSRGVGGRLGDNVDVARALALVHVHTARALFFIILIILKAKLIFLIYLISTPRRASCKIYQNPRTKRAGFLGWVRLSHQHIIIKRRFQNPYFFLDVLTSVVALIAKRYKTRTIKYEALGSSLLAPQVIT